MPRSISFPWCLPEYLNLSHLPVRHPGQDQGKYVPTSKAGMGAFGLEAEPESHPPLH